MANPPTGDSSTIRDHLANERTYLAWIRTALALIGLGFIVERMGPLLTHVTLAPAIAAAQSRTSLNFSVLGIVLLGIGTLLAVWSAYVHEKNRKAIDARLYIAQSLSVILISLLVFLSGVFLLVVLVASGTP